MTRIFTAAFCSIAFLIALAVDVRAHPTWGLAVDAQNQVYVSDLETIWKIDDRGAQSVFRPGVRGRHIHEMRIDFDGNLVGEDLSYDPATALYTSSIWKMTAAGAFSYIVSPTTQPPTGTSIWRDRRGSTYLAQSGAPAQQMMLLKRTSGGAVTTIIGSQKDADAFR